MIAIIDYDAGNLLSVDKALRYLGFEAVTTDDERRIREADAVVLPGVGAFPDAMASLKAKGLDRILREEAGKKPLLGICLGMQLLFEKSYEFGETEGLCLIPGAVRKIEAEGLKIPHMGWNDLTMLTPSPLTREIGSGDFVYFVHSYCADTEDRFINATTHYGERIPALVSDGGYVHGAQFHPEKSSEVGLRILACFGGLIQ